MNPGLRTAIDNAKAENMPVDNIDRAIKKGSGEAKDAMQIEEVIYEGYGPGGCALYIETLTDNRNRTFSTVKLLMSKNAGNMGSAGAVSYLFNKKGVITASAVAKSAEEIELAAIDAGAEDVRARDEKVEIHTAPQEVMKIKHLLEVAGVKIESAGLTYIPSTNANISDPEIAKKLLNLIEILEEEDDVTTVYHNAVIDPAILEKLEE